jgi:hypothetical protein
MSSIGIAAADAGGGIAAGASEACHRADDRALVCCGADLYEVAHHDGIGRLVVCGGFFRGEVLVGYSFLTTLIVTSFSHPSLFALSKNSRRGRISGGAFALGLRLSFGIVSIEVVFCGEEPGFNRWVAIFMYSQLIPGVCEFGRVADRGGGVSSVPTGV